ncbi:MAG: MFS transporter [Coriobacteriales bacterium]|jgi:MFS family permease|nr:MFS transporter [Coriobacteriales bacterium]
MSSNDDVGPGRFEQGSPQDLQEHPKAWYWGVQDKQLSNGQAWMTLIVLFVYGFMSMFGFIKVAPVMTVMWDNYGFDLANGGLIQTFYTMSGVLLMFPGTWLSRKIGLKVTVVMACGISLLGAVVGIFAFDQFTMLLSRTIEGIGAGFIMFLGANVATRIFPREKLGMAMAVWSIWAPAGVFLALLLSPYFFSWWGLQSLWVVSAIAYLICLAWLLVSFKLPKVDENILALRQSQAASASAEQAGGSSFVQKLKTPRVMLISSLVISASFLIWGFMFGGCVNSFYPTYLTEVKGLDLAGAGFWPSVISLLTLPLGILAGWLSDKTGTRKWFVTISYLLMAVVMATVAWREDADMTAVYIFVVMMSLFSATIPMGTRSAIPEYTPDPKISDYSLTLMVVLGNLGQAMGVIFGASVSAFGGGDPALGWQAAGLWLLAPCCLLAGIVTMVFCKNDLIGKKRRFE